MNKGALLHTNRAEDPALLENAMRMAINYAQQFVGATAPNPPVGAVALDAQGEILIGAGHAKAGSPHAEAKLLATAQELGLLEKIHTVVVTLEPCNHHGRTPPCTKALIAAGVKCVVVGTRDPNPKVKGGGVERLRKAGTKVIEGVLQNECTELIRSFAHWSRTGRPYVTVKQAFTSAGSMIPPKGHTTFTSDLSLQLAHELRRRADALWTGSGTILVDNPAFTVRRVKDHPGKKRYLIIADRRGRIPAEWCKQAEARGFVIVTQKSSFEETLDFLGQKGVLEVLVEAGPTLSGAILKSGLWNEHVIIKQGGDQDTDGHNDTVEIRRNDAF